METYEEYISHKTNIKDQKLLLSVIQKFGFDEFLSRMMSLSESEDDSHDAYDALRLSIINVNSILQNNPNEISKTENEKISILLHAMYEFDEHCGISEELRPNMPQEEELRILKILDSDREKFKQILIKYIKICGNDEILFDFIAHFAKLIFMFNGYQAPMRNDPLIALRDSMGLNNLFVELLEEINDENI